MTPTRTPGETTANTAFHRSQEGRPDTITPARRRYRWLTAAMILLPLAVALIAFAVRAWRDSGLG